MLKNLAAKAEVNKLSREEFAFLDETLAARKQAGSSQAQIAKRIGIHAPAISRIDEFSGTLNH